MKPVKICGIILAKENSNRFPGKNYHEVDGKPMFMHGVDLMKKFISPYNIYVAANSDIILGKTSINGCVPMSRLKNACHDEQPFIDVLRTTYMQIAMQYDIIVSVLANSINHDSEALRQAIEIIQKNDKINEVRSFDIDGIQTGIFVFREKFLLDFNTSLHDSGSVIDPGREIHYIEELST